MKIYILRHGKAEGFAAGVQSDAKRRLTPAGRREMELVADGIKNINVSFDYVVSSPLARARETADIVARSLHGNDMTVTVWDEMKPESNVTDAHRLLAKLPPDTRILLVGHEPHLSCLASSIISQTGAATAAINLKKGGLAILDGNTRNSKITGTLRSLLTPRQIRLCR